MDLSAGTLFAALALNVAGIALFIYGKKQRRGPHLAAGILLSVGPYFFAGAVSILCFGGLVGGATVAAVRAGL